MRLALLSGVIVLAATWLGPLPTLARQDFSAHMIMHVAVVAVAAPLLALGLAGSRLDPVRRQPALFAPLPAAALELLVVWGWHAPLAHQWSRQLPGALALEQSMFLAVALLTWLSALGGDGPRRAARAGVGVIGLLLTSMHMTLLGALLTLAPRQLYAQLCGPGPLFEQQLGGLLMLAVGGLSYLFGGLYLLWLMLADGPTAADGAKVLEVR